MSIRKLAGQTAIYGVSSIIARMLNYMLTPYFTRVMTTGQYGVIGDLYSLIPFALVVLTLGLESGFFRFAGKAKDGSEKDRVFSTAWAAVTGMAVLFLGLVFIFLDDITRVTGYSETPSFIVMTAGIVALDAFLAAPFARLREQGRAKTFVVVRIVSVVLTILFSVFFYSVLPRIGGRFYYPSFGPGYYLLANLIVSFLTVFILLPTLRGLKFAPDRKILVAMMAYSLPLLISGIAGTANEFIDRQMIKYLLPSGIALEAVGIYSAVAKIGVILLLFTQMYRMAAEPYFLADFKKEDFVRTNAEAMKYFIIVSVGIFLGIVLFVDFFELLVGPGFRQGMYILPVLLVSNIMTGVILNLSFWYKQMSRTGFAIVVTGTGLVFTVVFNVLLVPRLGIMGAALARLICELAMMVLSYVLNRRFCPTPYDLKRIGTYVGAGVVFYGLGLQTEGLPAVLKYLLNLAFLCLYGVMFLRLEKIDLRSLATEIKSKK